MMYKRSWSFSILVLCFLFAGCAGPGPAPQTMLTPPKVKFVAPKKKTLVAVAGFENRSTFAAEKLWDTCSQLLATRLIETGYFRVVEWERMKRLFDWDALSTSSLVKVPESREKAHKILLCEHFVTGAVTYFDVKKYAKISAISKKKTYETTVRVDLLLQDASTGEYLAASSARALESQVIGGGQTGTWDPGSADRALDHAIQKAVYKLILRYQNQ